MGMLNYDSILYIASGAALNLYENLNHGVDIVRFDINSTLGASQAKHY